MPRQLKKHFRSVRRESAHIDGTYHLPERIEYWDSHWLEVSDVPGNDRQTVLQCGGGDEQVCSVVP